MEFCETFFDSVSLFKHALVSEIRGSTAVLKCSLVSETNGKGAESNQRVEKILSDTEADSFCYFDGVQIATISEFKSNPKRLTSTHLSCLSAVMSIGQLHWVIQRELELDTGLLDLVYAEMQEEKVSIARNDPDILPSAAAFAYAKCLMEMDRS